MSRPPGHADKLMLSAGKKLLESSSCSELTIREVVERAGVNLGMFHYHFKTREKFLRVLMTEVYGDCFARLRDPALKTSDPLVQLRETLLILGGFFRENDKVLIALFRDLMNGESEVVRYSRRKIPPHATLLRRLVRKCQKQGIFPRWPLEHFAPLFFGVFGLPIIMVDMSERFRHGALPSLGCILSDEALERRIDTILSGLLAQKEKRVSS